MLRELFGKRGKEMTCREKLEIEHPEDANIRLIGDCPDEYGYAGEPKYCNPFVGAEECERCWEREVEELEMKREFTKADLQDGMVVELRDGKTLLALKRGNRLRMVLEDFFLDGNSLTDNLKSRLFLAETRHSLDVMRVFAPVSLEKVKSLMDLIEQKGELLWERRESMTIEEIEKELGYKIEIVAPPVGKDS